MKKTTFNSLIFALIFSINANSQQFSRSCVTSQSFIETTCDTFYSPTGKTWTSSGIYLDTIPNSVGCDSIMFYNITIDSSITITINSSACDSLISVNGKIWYSSGVYRDTTQTNKGCDSILIYNFTNGQYIFDTLKTSICDSMVSISGKIWKTTGYYSDTISHISSCDSIYLYDITILTPSYDTLFVSVCDSFISPSGKVWDTTGTYYDTTLNTENCSLFHTCYLSKGEQKIILRDIIMCDTFVSPSGKIWTTSGTYYDTTTHISSCDSLFEITIQVGAFYDTITDTVCNVFLSPSGNSIRTSGNYMDTIPGYLCDSIIYTLKIEVNYSTKDTIRVFDCDTVFSSNSSNFWTTSGLFLDTIFSNIHGCDSTFYYEVTIGNSLTNVAETHCWSYTLPSGSQTYTQSGRYYDTLSSISGCDSVLYITLEINIADTTVVKRPGTLIAFVSGATYQWLDCNNGMIPVSGATSQQFLPLILGSYAVEIRKYGCVDTSSCYTTIQYAGISEKNNSINPFVYPNPTKDITKIEFGGLIQKGRITIIDITGKYLLDQELINKTKFQIDASTFLKGIYIIKIESEEGTKAIRLIKN